ncbi:MAG: sulfite exporter TauE/SafE family protein [Fuerstiella sp.]|nr:sulfite exporter TauE/SafE family protein [Fuerstiella sp.]
MAELNTSTLLLSAIAGGIVGILSGLFGIGGGFLLVPLLNTLLGIPLPVAVGSATCYALGPATTALLTRRPTPGLVELPLILAGGLFAGVFAGTTALTNLESLQDVKLSGRAVPAVDLVVLSCYSLLMSGIAFFSLCSTTRSQQASHRSSSGVFAGWCTRPKVTIPDLTPSHYSIPLLATLGFGVGCFSGFLGMSGGLILIPATVYLLGLKVRDATTVTVAIVWIVSCQACVLHALHHRVNLWLTIALLVAGPVGARLGAELGMRLQGRQLRIGFGLMVLCASLLVWFRLWNLVFFSQELQTARELCPWETFVNMSMLRNIGRFEI